MLRDFINLLWQSKIQILAGAFWALAIYAYFYQQKKKIRLINLLKRRSELFKKQIVILKRIIVTTMESKNGYSVKERLNDHIEDDDKFKETIWKELKGLRDKITDEVKGVQDKITTEVKKVLDKFNDYMLENNNRIAELEADQKVTASRVVIYAGLGIAILLLVVDIIKDYIF
jgi:hypothetical protein